MLHANLFEEEPTGQQENSRGIQQRDAAGREAASDSLFQNPETSPKFMISSFILNTLRLILAFVHLKHKQKTELSPKCLFLSQERQLNYYIQCL